MTQRRVEILWELRSKGFRLVAYAVLSPIFGGFVGAVAGTLLGLSVGGTTVLATLVASSSYVAVPAASRVMVPEATPTLSWGPHWA